MKVCSLYLLVMFILVAGCNEKSMEKEKSNIELTDDYSNKIDSLLNRISPRKFNGVVLITKNGETKYLKEHGYSNFEHRTPIHINDKFRIQSNTKQITAVLILKEVEKGSIDLKMPIKNYLPELKSSWKDSVTVHHLLNMSSGIVDVNEPLIFESGTDYHYSNPSYALLGRIIKNVTGKDYSEAVNALFKSIGMNNSYCSEMNINDKELIDGYNFADGKYTLMEFDDPGFTSDWWMNFVPAGGIISNAKDLDTWESKLHSGRLLKPESYDLMTQYSVKGKHTAFGDKKIGYGYGIRIDDNEDLKIMGHSGRGLGFVSMKFHVSKTNVNVIILENVHSEDNSVYYFENEIRKIVINSQLTKP